MSFEVLNANNLSILKNNRIWITISITLQCSQSPAVQEDALGCAKVSPPDSNLTHNVQLKAQSSQEKVSLIQNYQFSSSVEAELVSSVY